MREERTHFTRRNKCSVLECVIQRLNAEWVACRQELASLGIPQDKREHPTQPCEESLPIVDQTDKEHFCV